jgi:hypothetical protein
MLILNTTKVSSLVGGNRFATLAGASFHIRLRQTIATTRRHRSDGDPSVPKMSFAAWTAFELPTTNSPILAAPNSFGVAACCLFLRRSNRMIGSSDGICVADRCNHLDIIKLRKLRHDLRLGFKRSFHAQRGWNGSKRSCKGCFRSVKGPAPIAQNVPHHP